MTTSSSRPCSATATSALPQRHCCRASTTSPTTPPARAISTARSSTASPLVRCSTRRLVGVDLKSYEVSDLQAFDFATPALNLLNPVYGVPQGFPGTVFADQTITQKQVGLYAQDQLKLGRLTLVLSGRNDWVNTFDNNQSRAEPKSRRQPVQRSRRSDLQHRHGHCALRVICDQLQSDHRHQFRHRTIIRAGDRRANRSRRQDRTHRLQRSLRRIIVRSQATERADNQSASMPCNRSRPAKSPREASSSRLSPTSRRS